MGALLAFVLMARSPRCINTLLIQAEVGDVDRVEKCLEHPININHRGGLFEQTALMVACRKKHREIVRVLLENRADVNIKDKEGLQALDIAAQEGDVSIILYLIRAGARSRDSALNFAAEYNWPEAVSYLLAPSSTPHEDYDTQEGYDIYEEMQTRNQALATALKSGSLEAARKLVRQGLANLSGGELEKRWIVRDTKRKGDKMKFLQLLEQNLNQRSRRAIERDIDELWSLHHDLLKAASISKAKPSNSKPIKAALTSRHTPETGQSISRPAGTGAGDYLDYGRQTSKDVGDDLFDLAYENPRGQWRYHGCDAGVLCCLS
ncbi:hypothetical protein AAMO2058_000514300 [Amorphochlora amoebiformis]